MEEQSLYSQVQNHKNRPRGAAQKLYEDLPIVLKPALLTPASATQTQCT